MYSLLVVDDEQYAVEGVMEAIDFEPTEVERRLERRLQIFIFEERSQKRSQKFRQINPRRPLIFHSDHFHWYSVSVY